MDKDVYSSLLASRLGGDLSPIIPVGTWWGSWSDSPHKHRVSP